MPEVYREMFAAALPRLEAEETQRFVRALVAGTGHMPKRDFEEYMRELDMRSWGRRAGSRTSVRPKSFQEFQAMAGAISGFRVSLEGGSSTSRTA